MRRLTILGIIFLSLWVSTADAQLLVEQGKVRFTVTPNKTIMNQVVIHNTTKNAVKVKAYWEDFIYTAPYKGEKDFFPAGSGKYSCASWVNFMPREFTIPPYGQQNIDYTFRVPADAHGGYYGVLFLESSGTGEIPEGVTRGVNIVTRVGALFFLETKDKDKACTINIVGAGKEGINGKFFNKGNVFLLPQGVYYLLNDEGIVADRGDLSRGYTVPGSEWDFVIPYPKNLAAGRYHMVLTIDLEDEVSQVVEFDLSKDAQGQYQLSNIQQ